jgi:radical SAM superfamily enzyme YgiQ (UPF0313 family)
VPLAAGYLKMFARSQGLETAYAIDLLPAAEANRLGDQALVAAIIDRRPWLVGFTCYVWNIDRTLWIAERLKERRPDLLVVLGGPEVTPDNAWVLAHPAVDYAAIGEGEQTFAELLTALLRGPVAAGTVNGLFVRETRGGVARPIALPLAVEPSKCSIEPFVPRRPMADLDAVSSPYLAGILDAAEERMLLLETIRGCIFKCKFCYYPKSYDGLYFVSPEKIEANLRHARDRGAREVVLLDPTLNQRRDFDNFLRLLARNNPDGQFTYFGELRAEGITPVTARLLREANFTEVEVGLQSIDPSAQKLMDRKNNLRALERGIRAMLDEGIQVKVDLILGLPGDTVDSIRDGMHYLRNTGLYTDVQVFHLAVLPGTAFRQEAAELGLAHQPRPPYYVLRTPTLRPEDLFALMGEAAEVFEMEWDPLPPPELPRIAAGSAGLFSHVLIDLDEQGSELPARVQARQALAFTLWLRSSDFSRHKARAAALVERLLEVNPFTTLQVVIEPRADPRRLTADTLRALAGACHGRATYLDRYYAMQPGRPVGAKRLVVLLSPFNHGGWDEGWLAEVEEYATVLPNRDLTELVPS